MENIRIKPKELLDQFQLSEIRHKQDIRNVLALFFDWGLIFSSFILFYIFPSTLTFICSLIVIGSRQFALAVLVHDGAHNLLFSNPKINDFVSQWFCAYPIFQDNRVYRPYHLKHHRHTETEEDPDLVLSSPFPITKRSFTRKVFRDLTGWTGVRRYGGSLISIFKTKGDNLYKKFLLIFLIRISI